MGKWLKILHTVLGLTWIEDLEFTMRRHEDLGRFWHVIKSWGFNSGFMASYQAFFFDGNMSLCRVHLKDIIGMGMVKPWLRLWFSGYHRMIKAMVFRCRVLFHNGGMAASLLRSILWVGWHDLEKFRFWHTVFSSFWHAKIKHWIWMEEDQMKINHSINTYVSIYLPIYLSIYLSIYIYIYIHIL